MKVFITILAATFTLSLADVDDDFLAESREKIPNNMWRVIKANQTTIHWGSFVKELTIGDAQGCPMKNDINLKEIEEYYDPPEFFDARENWPQCKSISRVWIQGSCFSSWVIPGASMMSDRLCIHKNIDFLVSPEDILSCCTYTNPATGQTMPCGGCNGGGDAYAGLNYFANHGVCSGGKFGESGTCKPYSIEPSSPEPKPTPKCFDSCTDSSYEVPYEEDLVKGGTGCYMLPNNDKAIMQEIQTNGPVFTAYEMYQDFFLYDGGVYTHKTGRLIMIKGARIIGWGTEDDTPYWLLVNTWGEDWGEEGLIKMFRGNNHCGVGTNVFAALP